MISELKRYDVYESVRIIDDVAVRTMIKAIDNNDLINWTNQIATILRDNGIKIKEIGRISVYNHRNDKIHAECGHIEIRGKNIWTITYNSTNIFDRSVKEIKRIIVHELCHTVHYNHGMAFMKLYWQAVRILEANNLP